MTLRRTGLAGSRTAVLSFARDRSDGGGGGDPSKRQADALNGDDDEDMLDDDDSDDSDDDDEKDDEKDGEDDEPKPPVKPDGTPYTQTDIDNLREALRKERRANRAKKKTDGKDGKDDAPDPDEQREQIETEVSGKWKTATVRSAARSALSEAGLIGKPERLLKLLDLDDIDVEFDDDGEVDIDGLDEQIADLKKEYPHLFRKKGGKLDASAGRDRDESRRSDEKKSASEIQADLLLGKL